MALGSAASWKNGRTTSRAQLRPDQPDDVHDSRRISHSMLRSTPAAPRQHAERGAEDPLPSVAGLHRKKRLNCAGDHQNRDQHKGANQLPLRQLGRVKIQASDTRTPPAAGCVFVFNATRFLTAVDASL